MNFEKAFIYKTDTHEPYFNLAVETHLLTKIDGKTIIMYLWQNADTVVIGKNQNCFVECNIARMKSDNVKLARRSSGGGAVFHDLGNLNFTFLTSKESYSPELFQKIILAAVRRFGIGAEISGRNDMLVKGRKFSGNAVFHGKTASFFHGTLLIASKLERLPLYLNPSEKKLAAKSVKSLASRVANLREFCPSLDVEQMKEALREEFALQTALSPQACELNNDDFEKIEKLRLKNSSPEWLFSDASESDYVFCERFDWGELRIELKLKNNIIEKCKIYSDCMDASLPPSVQSAFTGARFDPEELKNKLSGAVEKNKIDDIINTIFGGNGDVWK